LGAFDYFQLPSEFELLVQRTQQLVDLRKKIDKLRADADLDHLTGLANRRRFRAALKGEIERWRRYGSPCSLLLIDIDHLKKIPDSIDPIKTVVTSPLMGFVTYSLDDCYSILAVHGPRHIGQAKRVTEAEGFPRE